MAEKKPYYTVAGFIQSFGNDDEAVTERDANGQTVRDITIKAIGSQKLVRLTVWEEHAAVPLGPGYFVVADGKFSVNKSKDGTKEYYNLSASTLLAFPPAPKNDTREVVNQQSAASAAGDDVSVSTPVF